MKLAVATQNPISLFKRLRLNRSFWWEETVPLAMLEASLVIRYLTDQPVQMPTGSQKLHAKLEESLI